MYYAIYAELNIVCVLILAYILLKLKTADRRAEVLAFTRVVWATLAVLLIDTAWALQEKTGDTRLIPLNYALNSLYLFDAGLISFFWMLYIEIKLKKRDIMKKKSLLLILTPMVILSLFCLTAPLNGMLFYVDPQNIYHRGPFHIVQVIVSYGYLISASGQVLLAFRNRKDQWSSSELQVLLSFFVLPALGGVLSSAFLGLPAVWPAGTLSLLMVFIHLQSRQISTDQLTGLNNRRTFDKYIADLLSGRQIFCLLMIDVDRFKQINDTFGHVEGDRALQETAQILKETCGGYEAFLARYGGDEFAVILKNKRLGEAEFLPKEICCAFDGKNALRDFPITVSIGMSERAPESTAESVIASADKRLYEAKSRFRNSAAPL